MQNLGLVAKRLQKGIEDTGAHASSALYSAADSALAAQLPTDWCTASQQQRGSSASFSVMFTSLTAHAVILLSVLYKALTFPDLN